MPRRTAQMFAYYGSSFPFVLPFSQMYPLCCIDIRNFLNQFYFFSDDHFQHPSVIDETLKKVPWEKNPYIYMSES